MPSHRKLLANRRNATRSTGPRSREGKAKASRNALRHGLARVFNRTGADREQITALAKAICPEDDEPCLQQAVLVAECQHLLHRVHAARAALLESTSAGANLRSAVPVLNQLERYERRAWSRRRRATELLEALREMRNFRLGAAR
jgi:hypothetical protein